MAPVWSNGVVKAVRTPLSCLVMSEGPCLVVVGGC